MWVMFYRYITDNNTNPDITQKHKIAAPMEFFSKHKIKKWPLHFWLHWLLSVQKQADVLREWVIDCGDRNTRGVTSVLSVLPAF